MTATQMLPAVGQLVSVRFEDVHVACIVQDVKESWGKARLQVVPVNGSGSQWVELGRVSLPPAPCVQSAQAGPPRDQYDAILKARMASPEWNGLAYVHDHPPVTGCGCDTCLPAHAAAQNYRLDVEGNYRYEEFVMRSRHGRLEIYQDRVHGAPFPAPAAVQEVNRG